MSLNNKNNDMSFYIKKLSNHIEKMHYSLFDRKEYEDCSIMNLWVIDFLYHQDRDVFQKDIENEFFINRATASKMLKLMEEKKLIQRICLESDTRCKKVILTDKGLKLQKIAQEIRKDVENKLTQDLSDEETEMFKLLCIKIMKGLS